MSRKIQRFDWQTPGYVIDNPLSVGQCSSATIQVDGLEGTITVAGKTNPDSGTFYAIKVIDYSTLTILDSITTDGNYLVLLEGLHSIKLTSDEEVDADIFITMEE